MRDDADVIQVRSTNAKPAGEAAREWRANLPRELRQRSLTRGGVIVSVSLTIYIVSMVGAVLGPNFFWRTVSLSMATLMIGALFVIGHDAAHNSFTPYGWLNRLLGRLVLLPAWHPYTSWVFAHNTLHHGGTNLRGKHPDLVPLTKEEYDRLPRWRQLLEKFYRSPLGPGLSYLIGFYLGYILFPAKGLLLSRRRQFQWDRLLVLGFFVLQVLGMYLLALRTTGLFLPPLAYAFFDTILPWVLWVQFMGFVTYLQHTHPRLAWYDDPKEWSFYHVQLKSSTHVVFPYPIERLLNNIMDHAAHHIDPTIPLYHLPKSQRLLEESCEEHAAVIRWSPWQHLELCRVCKLYDFERHCWTDFEGNATSEMGLPGLAFKDAESTEATLVIS
ncbi:MAG: fatty acid desaturase [Luteolibacter sp.]|uniref:fatty acid desaturase n=1 Tax=Luteolibacter sp. TaxID=1962973 RepID=UPI0032635DF4